MKILQINLTYSAIPLISSPEAFYASEYIGSIPAFTSRRLKKLLDEIHEKHDIRTFGKIEVYLEMNEISMAAFAYLTAALPIHPDFHMKVRSGFQHLALWTFSAEGNDWKQTFLKKEVVEK